MSDILRVGDHSPRVAEVRTALTRLGLVPDSDKEIKQSKGQTFTDPETYFDEDLAEVIKGMQQARGIMLAVKSMRSHSVPSARHPISSVPEFLALSRIISLLATT